MKIKWQCALCQDILISDSREHHKMDWCKCASSALDLEHSYCRQIGSVVRLETYDLEKLYFKVYQDRHSTCEDCNNYIAESFKEVEEIILNWATDDTKERDGGPVIEPVMMCPSEVESLPEFEGY